MAMSMEKHPLFTPMKVGRMELKHRVVMSPMSRSRASKDWIPGEEMKEHFSMRAAVPGTLIIGEASYICLHDMAQPWWRQAPGIWNRDQVKGWKSVIDEVHRRGSFFAIQLWSPGRLVDPDILDQYHKDFGYTFPYVSAGAVPVVGYSRTPEEMSRELIHQYVDWFRESAKLALEAGVDAIEFQAMYLLEEFLKDITNIRTDEYGFQTPENATRFFFEILEAIVGVAGQDRVGVKLNPWMQLKYYDTRDQGNPLRVYTYLIDELVKRYPNIAWLHIIEPRVSGTFDPTPGLYTPEENNQFIKDRWKGPYISAGGHGPKSAFQKTKEDPRELALFARWYTSNPDLPIRLEHSIPLTQYDRPTFYTDGLREGYNSFRWSEEGLKIAKERGIDVEGFE